MAGAHSRSSRHERTSDPDGGLGPEPRDPDPGSDQDRDYGEIFRPRPSYDPAPPSPPVGLPSAFSSASFRAPGDGRHAEPEPAAVGGRSPSADEGRPWSASPAAGASSTRSASPGASWTGSTTRSSGPTGSGGSSTRSTALAPPAAVPPPPPRTGSGETPARPGAAPVTPRAPHSLSGPQALAAPPGRPGGPARPAAPGARPGAPAARPGRGTTPAAVPPPAPAAPRRPAGQVPPASRPATPQGPGRPAPAPATNGAATGAPPRPAGSPPATGSGPRPPAGPGTASGPRPPAGPATGTPVKPPNGAAPVKPPHGAAPVKPNGAAPVKPPHDAAPVKPNGAPATPGTPGNGAPPKPGSVPNGATAVTPNGAPTTAVSPGTTAKPPVNGRPTANGTPTTVGGSKPAVPPARTVDGTAIGPAVDPLDAPDEDDEHGTPSPRDAATTTARSTGTRTAVVPQSARTRAERRAAGRDGLTRAAGRGRAGARPTRSGARRGTDRAADARPTPPRGRIAAAVAALVVAVAAKVRHWPGGERLLTAGHWVDGKVQAYLDGKDPASLTKHQWLWRRRRRAGYALLATAIGVPVLTFALGWLLIPVPNADSAVESQLNTVSFSDGSVIARVAPGEQGNREKVTINQIPLPVQHAVLSAEDRTFYTNSGFDIGGILHAAFKQVTGGAGGGSTITQQYVKNAMVGDEHSYFRKFRELIISAKITQEYSKDQVLEDYLNSIYLGRGAYGIQAASQAYFNKPVEQLTPAEGAVIAGLIQAPSQWDPAVNLEGSQRRWNYVMDGMVSSGWLSPAQRAVAVFPATVPPRKTVNGVPDDDRGHIYSAVKDELQSLGIDEDALVTEGLQIQTTIDPKAQQEATDAVHQEMKGKPANLRTAAVSVDPRTGDVLSYYGGDNGSGLDYAQVQKQAGSTFKPFVMLAALERNPPIGISTQFDGQQIPGKTVRNVEGADCSSCSLKRAMTLSNNVVFTALGNEVGPQAVANAAHQAGISAKLDDPNSGIALGNVEVTPLEMAGAYATFANDGVYHKPHLVQKVTTSSGEVLYDHAADQGEQRIDPKVARNVTEAMRDVPTYDGASLSGGRISAGKTGTVQSHVENQNNDAWMVGYTPSVVASVWVGTDDNTPIQYADGKPIYGHGIPSDIWQTFMNGATQGTPKQTFGDFVPVAGTDPGETASGEGQQAGTSSASPTTSSKPSTKTSDPTTPSATAAPTPAPAPAEAPGAAAPAAPPAAAQDQGAAQAPDAAQPEAPAQDQQEPNTP